jgi:hypothetical protein
MTDSPQGRDLPAWLDGPPMRRACGAALGLFALALLVPWQPADRGPIGAFDYSWMLVLHDAAAAGRQFGREIILPQGPLGFIANDIYDPRTHVIVLLARSAIAITIAAVLWKAAKPVMARPPLALAWAVAILALVGRTTDHLYPACAALLLFAYFVVNDRRARWDVYALAVVLGVASLVKVNHALHGLVAIAAIGVDQVILRRGNWRAALMPLAYAASFLAFYLAARQRPWNLFAFIRGWVLTTGGYAEANGLPGAWIDAAAYLVVAAMIVAMVTAFAWRRWRRGGLILPVGTAGVLLLLYKHSFLRQDNAHAQIAPMVATALALAYAPPLCGLARGGKRERVVLLTVMSVVAVSALVTTSILSSYTGESLAGYSMSVAKRCADSTSSALRGITDPSHLRREFDATQSAIRDEVRIPFEKIEGSVDVFPHRADVLFAYGLPYQPRPSVYALGAASPALAEMNAAHLRDAASAPRSILFNVELVDRNFPTILDGRCLPELLTLYDVIDTTGDMLVLRRSPVPRTYRFTPLLTRRANFDEPIAIPAATDAPLWAKIHFNRRAAGRVVSLLYKPLTLGIEVHTRGNAEPQTYRLLPTLADEQGFLLSPLVADRSAYAALASRPSSGEPAALNVTAMKVIVADGSVETFFEDDFEIDLQKLEIGSGG